MRAAPPIGLNTTAVTTQLTAISTRLGVGQTPYSMTRQGLAYKQFDPKNPYAQEPLGALIQTRERISRKEFVERLPFDSTEQSYKSLAENMLAIQSIVDNAGFEMKLFADRATGDYLRRMEAASKLQSFLEPPTPGLTLMPVEDAFSDYRNAFMASVRSAMLLNFLLDESHLDVANQFFHAAVNLLQANDHPAAAMFAEVAFDRIGNIKGDPSLEKAKRGAWYRAFAAKAWHGSLAASDPYELTRFKIDRGLHNGWSNENPFVMIELYRASEKLNLSQERYADAVGDMLRAALLTLDRGGKILGEDSAWIQGSEFVGRAATSAAKVARAKGSAQILSELHRRMTGKAA